MNNNKTEEYKLEDYTKDNPELAKEVEKLIKIEEMSEVEKMYKLANVAKPVNCEHYDYPDFTAEKQIELIKLLAGFWVHINDAGGQINISTGGGYVSYYAKNLADAIALCINSKWNNLTEQERTEIAEILKG